MSSSIPEEVRTSIRIIWSHTKRTPSSKSQPTRSDRSFHLNVMAISPSYRVINLGRLSWFTQRNTEPQSSKNFKAPQRIMTSLPTPRQSSSCQPWIDFCWRRSYDKPRRADIFEGKFNDSCLRLLKVQKPERPLRMIVHLLDSTLYKLSKRMFGHFKLYIPGSDHNITNAWKFLESIKHVNIAQCRLMWYRFSHPYTWKMSVRLSLTFCACTAAAEMHEQPKCLLNYFHLGKCYFQQFWAPRYLGSLSKQRLEWLVFSVITPSFVILNEDQVAAAHLLISSTLPRIEFTMETLSN